MKRMIVGLLAVGLLSSLTVMAGEKAKTAGDKKAAVQEMTVTGKLTKDAKEGFCVMEADGTKVKVMTQKAAKEGEAAVVDLDKYIDKEVKLVGKGITRTGKAGKKTSVIKTVTSVEEAPAPAGEAAAPAPAGEAAAPAVE